MKCSIKKCKSKSVAKGLCSKHYMRKRRTGDPDQTRKAGRKPDTVRAEVRDIHPEMSSRSLTRFVKAFDLIQRFTNGDELWRDALNKAVFRRPPTEDGSNTNVSRLLKIAESLVPIDEPELETDAPKSV